MMATEVPTTRMRRYRTALALAGQRAPVACVKPNNRYQRLRTFSTTISTAWKAGTVGAQVRFDSLFFCCSLLKKVSARARSPSSMSVFDKNVG